MSEAEVSLNHQTGLNPFVCAVLVSKLDGFEITRAGVIVVEAVGFHVLNVGCSGDCPVVIHEPADGRPCTFPVDIVNVLGQQVTVVLLTTQSRAEVVVIHSGAEDVVDVARVARAETGQADGDAVAQRNVDRTVDVIAVAATRG